MHHSTAGARLKQRGAASQGISTFPVCPITTINLLKHFEVPPKDLHIHQISSNMSDMKKIPKQDPESWFYSTGSSEPRNNEGLEVPTSQRGDVTRRRFYYVPRENGTALHRCRITLTCERDKVFPTSLLDGKSFHRLFSGGLNVRRSRAESALHGNTEGSVQTKQQMHGVKSECSQAQQWL